MEFMEVIKKRRSVGYAAEEPEEIERKSLEELVFYEEWQE